MLDAIRNHCRRHLLLAVVSLACVFTAQVHAADEKFIISGASGQLGELTIQELLKRGVSPKDLILVSRTPDKLQQYVELGASARYGDLTKPESLAAAYQGGTRMLLISIGMGEKIPRPELHNNGFTAAVKAGVKHIVYTSFIGADTGTSFLAIDHRQSEAKLKASGASWTMLRNGLYAEFGILGAALDMAKTGKAIVPYAEIKSAPVTRDDCAAAAAGALLSDQFENKAFDITGPALIGTEDIAASVSEITGKHIEIVKQSEAEAKVAAAKNNGMGAGGLSTPAVVTHAVQDLSGRPATGLRDLLLAHKDDLLAAAK